MRSEKPVIDYGDSIKRGNAECERLDSLIKKAGGIIPYMAGPRYHPIDHEGVKESKALWQGRIPTHQDPT